MFDVKINICPTFAKITGVTFKSILRKTTIDLNSYICTNNLMLPKLLSFLIVYAHYYYYNMLILHVVLGITLSGFSRSEYHTRRGASNVMRKI